MRHYDKLGEYMRSKLTILLLFITCLLSACSTRLMAPEYTADYPLGENEALLYLAVHNPNERVTFFFKGKEGSFETPEFGYGLNKALIRVPADRYEMKALYFGAVKLYPEDFLTLKLRAGEVTYAGDFAIDGLNTMILNRSETRFAELLRQYPELEDVYMVHDGEIVGGRRMIQEGMQRVPNTSGRLGKDSSTRNPD